MKTAAVQFCDSETAAVFNLAFKAEAPFGNVHRGFLGIAVAEDLIAVIRGVTIPGISGSQIIFVR